MTEKEKVIKRIKEGKYDYKYIYEYLLPHYTSEENLDVLLEIYRNNKYEHYFGDITLVSHLNLADKKFISFEAIKKIVSESEALYITFVKYNLRNIILKKISTDVSIIEVYTFLIDNITTRDQVKVISDELKFEIASSVYEDVERKLYLKTATLNLYNSSLAVIRDLNPKGYHQTIDDFKLFLKFYSKINGIVSVNTAYKFYKEYNDIAKIIIGEQIKINSDMIINASLASFPIMVSFFPRELLSKSMLKIYSDTDKLVNASSKINTLSKNPNITYEFMKYVYPTLRHDLSLKFIRYYSEATTNLIDYCSLNNHLVRYWLKIIKAYDLFKLDEKGLHEAFENFECITTLLMNLVENNISINYEQALNIKRILLGKNYLEIETYNELLGLEKISINNLFERIDGYEFDGIGNVFGLNSIYELKNIYHKYNFANFAFLKDLYLTIRKYYGEEKFNEIKFTHYEISVIKLIKSISEVYIDALYKDVFERFLEKENHLNLVLELKEIIRKMQQVYALYLNAKLTNLNCLNYSQKDGLKIYCLKNEPFNFLVHTFEGFDRSLTYYASLLEKEPLLWDKLEGASTISYSSISDKSFYMVSGNNPNKIKLLFNKIPEDSFLYMYYEDLMVNHGSHNYNPTCEKCSYTTLEIHNRQGGDGVTHYNEIATYREGVLPCAILSFDFEPSTNVINYAKKTNLPIVYIEKDFYLENIQSQKVLFTKLQKQYNKKYVLEIVNSKQFYHNRQKLLEIIINHYNERNIPFKEINELLLEIEHIMKVSECDKFGLNEIQTYRIIINILNKLYPNSKIKIDINRETLKTYMNGFFVWVDDEEFLITKQCLSTIKNCQLAINLRKHFNLKSYIESAVLNKNVNLLIQPSFKEKLYIEICTNDLEKIKDEDLITEFIFDYWIGIPRFAELPLFKDKNNSLKRFYGLWNLTMTKTYEKNNNINSFLNTQLYKKLFAANNMTDKLFNEALIWEERMKLLTKEEIEQIIIGLDILDKEEKQKWLDILFKRKRFVIDFLQGLTHDRENNNLKRVMVASKHKH